MRHRGTRAAQLRARRRRERRRSVRRRPLTAHVDAVGRPRRVSERRARPGADAAPASASRSPAAARRARGRLSANCCSRDPSAAAAAARDGGASPAAARAASATLRRQGGRPARAAHASSIHVKVWEFTSTFRRDGPDWAPAPPRRRLGSAQPQATASPSCRTAASARTTTRSVSQHTTARTRCNADHSSCFSPLNRNRALPNSSRVRIDGPQTLRPCLPPGSHLAAASHGSRDVAFARQALAKTRPTALGWRRWHVFLRRLNDT